MKTFEEKEGGLVVVKNLSWVGPVRTIKVTSGKGNDQTTKEVYTVTVRTGYNSFTTPDFDTIDQAEEFHNWLTAELEEIET